MRTAVLTLLTTLALGTVASAQMTGTGPVNMMSGELLAPAAGRGPGAMGSFWKTDLWLKGTSGARVTLEFHTIDATTDAATATATVTMPSAVMFLPDVLKNNLGLDQAFGNIVIRGSGPVSATIRAYTPGGGGDYGTAFMAMPTLMAMRGTGGMMDNDDRYQLQVIGLQPQPRARVNLMVTNSGSVPISGTVDVIDADGQPPIGTPVSLPFSIRAYSSHQFGDILGGLTSRFGDGSQMQIRVRVTNNSTGMVMALASVVDNATNDTYTVMGSMMSFGSGGPGMMP